MSREPPPQQEGPSPTLDESPPGRPDLHCRAHTPLGKAQLDTSSVLQKRPALSDGHRGADHMGLLDGQECIHGPGH